MATEKGISRGVFTPVAGVKIPYLVLGEPVTHSLTHHFVVINDLFDCYDRHLSFFKPIVDSCPGMQVHCVRLLLAVSYHVSHVGLFCSCQLHCYRHCSCNLSEPNLKRRHFYEDPCNYDDRIPFILYLACVRCCCSTCLDKQTRSGSQRTC